MYCIVTTSVLDVRGIRKAKLCRFSVTKELLGELNRLSGLLENINGQNTLYGQSVEKVFGCSDLVDDIVFFSNHIGKEGADNFEPGFYGYKFVEHDCLEQNRRNLVDCDLKAIVVCNNTRDQFCISFNYAELPGSFLAGPIAIADIAAVLKNEGKSKPAARKNKTPVAAK